MHAHTDLFQRLLDLLPHRLRFLLRGLPPVKLGLHSLLLLFGRLLLDFDPDWEAISTDYNSGNESGVLGLSLFEYSFNLVTNLSKSSCFSCRRSKERRWSSGLYRCESLSVLQIEITQIEVVRGTILLLWA